MRSDHETAPLTAGRPVAGFLEVVRRKKRVSSSRSPVWMPALHVAAAKCNAGPDISPMSTSSEVQRPQVPARMGN